MSQRKLILLLLGCLIAILLQSRPIHDVDVFWQLKLGQIILQQGQLVRNDPFTATHTGQPVPPIAWLSQVLYAVVYWAGSWRLLHQANALVFAGSLLLASLAVRPEGDSPIFASRKSGQSPARKSGRAPWPWLADVLALGLGVLVAAPHCAIRPQVLAVFCFALLSLVAESRMQAWRKLLLCGLVVVLWQNMHPSVLLGAAAIGARAGAGWLRWLWDRQAARPWVPTAMALLATLGSLATPLGTGIFASSKVNAQISRELQVSEWMPLWHPAAREAGAWLVWLALGISLVLLLHARRRVRAEDLATCLVLAALSLAVYRLSLFWAVAMVPVWSRWVAAGWFADSTTPADRRPVRLGSAAGLLAGGLLAALIVPRLWGIGLFDRQLPLAAAAQLHRLGVHGVVYNYREWGGPLIWTGYPDWKVTIDGRLYLFPPAEWDRYRQIASGEVSLAQVQQWYRPDAFFLRPSYHQRFIRLLQDSGDWNEVYTDDNAAVFVRRRSDTEPQPGIQ